MALVLGMLRILGITTPNMSGSYQMFFAMTGLAGVALCELFVQDEGKSAEGMEMPETVVMDLDVPEVPEVAEVEREEEKQEEAPQQVQFIENPLPLPKKHVKKIMDYPLQPDASQMHFDREVDPQDDFDF